VINLYYNAVFEGGGMKAIALVGAYFELEKAGYKINNMAGSSAGAIVAALLAVGYTASEIEHLLKETDFLKFKQKSWKNLVPFSKLFNISVNYGIYCADTFETWLNDLLDKKGKTKFKHLLNKNYTSIRDKYKLQVTATDLTTKKLLILPHDIKDFNIEPGELSIATAVRMSMSLPIFYIPYILTNNKLKHLIVDGGLMSNYPIWLLDDGKTPGIPTFGFKFKHHLQEHNEITNTFTFLKSIIESSLESEDYYSTYQLIGDKERTIYINTTIDKKGKLTPVHTTDFDISKAELGLLFNNGRISGKKFINNWDFNNWLSKYRS
jgi:NTE family protein